MRLPTMRTLVAVMLFILLLPMTAQGQAQPLPPIPIIPPAGPSEQAPETPPAQEGTPAAPIPDIPISGSSPEDRPPTEPAPPPIGEEPSSTIPPIPPPEPTPRPPTPGTIPVSVYSNRVIFSPTLGIYQFFGNVTLETDQIFISADEASYTEQTQTVIARGIVSIRAEDGITYWGNMLEFNVPSRTWQFLNYTVEYPAAFLGPNFVAPVFVNGVELSGLPRGVRATDSHVTTCNLVEPHYELTCRQVDIYPGDKLIARDNDIYFFGRRILHVPYFYLSLRQRRSPIVPEFGHNDFEGYFARFLYQYVFNENQLGGIRLDLTSKRGIGLGIDHFYTISKGEGELFAYGREGLDEYVLRLDYTQLLPGQIGVTFRGDTRQNSQFTAQPTTLTNVTTNLVRRTAHTSTSLNYTRRLVESAFPTDSVTANLLYTSSVAAGGNLRTSSEYSSFGRSATGNPPDQELWNRLLWNRPLGFGTLNVRVDSRTDVDGDEFTGDQAFSGLQRLPELTLVSTQDELNLGFLKTRFPSVFTLGWGEFDEFSAGREQKLNRYQFEWRASLLNLLPQGSSTSITGNTSFLQTVYGDPDTTAQYRYTLNLTATTRSGEFSNVARYSRQEADGFTPFRFDTVYPYHTVTDSLQYANSNFRAYLTAGRDFRVDRWQDLSFRTVAQLTSNLSTSHAVAYDLNGSQWRNLVSYFRWRSDRPNLVVNLGSTYDFNNNVLGRVSTEMAWQINPYWNLEWRGSIDPQTGQYLYNEFLVIRDLHCWDAALYLSTEQQTFGVYFRLKALNIPLPSFGIGRGGQVLDTSQGQPL